MGFFYNKNINSYYNQIIEELREQLTTDLNELVITILTSVDENAYRIYMLSHEFNFDNQAMLNFILDNFSTLKPASIILIMIILINEFEYYGYNITDKIYNNTNVNIIDNNYKKTLIANDIIAKSNSSISNVINILSEFPDNEIKILLGNDITILLFQVMKYYMYSNPFYVRFFSEEKSETYNILKDINKVDIKHISETPLIKDSMEVEESDGIRKLVNYVNNTEVDILDINNIINILIPLDEKDNIHLIYFFNTKKALCVISLLI